MSYTNKRSATGGTMATVKCGPCQRGARTRRAGCTALLLAGSLLGATAWAQPPRADDAAAQRSEPAGANVICERLRAAETERCRPVARLGGEARTREPGAPERVRERMERRAR
jgi:hypothetical protein